MSALRKFLLRGSAAAFASAFSLLGGTVVEVDASRVLHACAPLIGGSNVKAHEPNFALGADGVDFVRLAREARIPLLRTLAYPDMPGPGHDPTPEGRGLDYFDRNVRAVLDSGARPLFIQYIRPGLRYLAQDGRAGGTVEDNLVFLVRRYLDAPYHLEEQWWEIGNEPDYDIDYRVPTPEAYAETFNRCHDALVKAGLRDRVKLCGPAVVSPYRYPAPDWDNSRFIDAVLRLCRQSVDVVTYHSYGPRGPAYEDRARLLRQPVLDRVESAAEPMPGAVGAAALAEAVRSSRLERPGAGIGLTEYNTNTLHQDVSSGLYNLIVQHFHLLNPLSRLTCSFVFDERGARYGGNGHFDEDGTPNANYWALWMGGNLRGKLVLETRLNLGETQPEYPGLLAHATRGEREMYLQVINRTDFPWTGAVKVRGVAPSGAVRRHVLDPARTPEFSDTLPWTDGGLVEFPPFSATVLVWGLEGGTVPTR